MTTANAERVRVTVSARTTRHPKIRIDYLKGIQSLVFHDQIWHGDLRLPLRGREGSVEYWGVGFCFVQEEGLVWTGETYVWGGIMLLSFMLGVDCMGSGYPSIAYADEERILMVHHNQPPPRVCAMDIEGVFYIEEENGSRDAGGI